MIKTWKERKAVNRNKSRDNQMLELADNNLKITDKYEQIIKINKADK